MLIGLGLSCTNSMPRRSGSARTNMRPCAWRFGLSASQTSNVSFTFLPSLISSLPRGKAARSSRGPFWAKAAVMPARAVVAASARHQRRSGSGRLRVRRIADIVLEFDFACKVEAGEQDPFAFGEAGGGPQAEAARLDAIDSAVCAQSLDALLGQR